MEEHTTIEKSALVKAMFEAGAHYGYRRSRRHPSVGAYIFGMKNTVEIFDLDKTSDLLSAAKEYINGLGEQGKQVLFVSGKHEGRQAITEGALSLGMPYVAGRWIGGTLTNLPEVRKRVDRLETLRKQREEGELAKYTKKERLLIDREIDKLENNFGGIVVLKGLPAALFVVDPRKETTAVREAHRLRIPIIALCGSDCDIRGIEYPVAGNDSSRSSVEFFVSEIVGAYRAGRAAAVAAADEKQPVPEAVA